MAAKGVAEVVDQRVIVDGLVCAGKASPIIRGGCACELNARKRIARLAFGKTSDAGFGGTELRCIAKIDVRAIVAREAVLELIHSLGTDHVGVVEDNDPGLWVELIGVDIRCRKLLEARRVAAALGGSVHCILLTPTDGQRKRLLRVQVVVDLARDGVVVETGLVAAQVIERLILVRYWRKKALQENCLRRLRRFGNDIGSTAGRVLCTLAVSGISVGTGGWIVDRNDRIGRRNWKPVCRDLREVALLLQCSRQRFVGVLGASGVVVLVVVAEEEKLVLEDRTAYRDAVLILMFFRLVELPGDRIA
jgi:hypothetical protein